LICDVNQVLEVSCVRDPVG